MFDTAFREVRHAARSLARQPGFSVVVVLTLALGIGANAAIFSVVNAVLLQPLPYGDPGRLVRVWSAYPTEDIAHGTTSPHDLDDWREQARAFGAIAGYPAVSMSGFVMTGRGEPDEVRTMYVTEGFFEVLGVEAASGRTLRTEDQRLEDNRVVVLSHGAWTRRFGADPAVVGRGLTLDGRPFIVVGVMPPEFEYPAPEVEMWAPLSVIPESGVPRRRPIRWLNVVARLTEGVTIDQARAEMNAIVGRLADEYPESNGRLTAATLAPLQEHMVGDVRTSMLTVFAAVGLVLLIGCVNVANLVLARAEVRSHEIGVRVALGAGRGRLLGLSLAEGLLLSLAGAVTGLALAFGGLRLLLAIAPTNIPRLSAVTIDGGVLAFTALVSVATGLGFGVIPVLRGIRGDAGAMLQGGRGVEGTRGGARSVLVVAEVAIVVVVAIVAGLMIRTYRQLLDVDPGFDTEGILTLRVAAEADDGYVDFLHEAVDRIAALPGVDGAGMVRPLPLRGDTFRGEGLEFQVVGREVPEGDQLPDAYLRFAGPGYFDTFGVPLLSGRDFTAADDRQSPFVVIVNRTLAERTWEGEDPVGDSIAIGDQQARIVGMVGDVRQVDLTEDPVPAVYVSHRQVPRLGMTFVVRASGDPTQLIGAIQREIWDLRPDQPIEDIATMDTVLRDSVARPRFAMALLSLFGALALLLAAVGVYGVMSYTVGQRRREIGIRLALGADPSGIRRQIAVRALTLSWLGVTLGFIGAAAGTRLMSGMLYGIPALDLPTFAGVGGTLLVISLVAAIGPATRASRIDPGLSLRNE